MVLKVGRVGAVLRVYGGCFFAVLILRWVELLFLQCKDPGFSDFQRCVGLEWVACFGVRRASEECFSLLRVRTLKAGLRLVGVNFGVSGFSDVCRAWARGGGEGGGFGCFSLLWVVNFGMLGLGCKESPDFGFFRVFVGLDGRVWCLGRSLRVLTILVWY